MTSVEGALEKRCFVFWKSRHETEEQHNSHSMHRWPRGPSTKRLGIPPPAGCLTTAPASSTRRCRRVLDPRALAVTFKPMTILRTSILAAFALLLAGTSRASSGKEEGFSDLTVEQVSDLIAKKDVDVFDNNGKGDY